MTREAKIGMLTGLGVIIVIGVLLSEYLGDPASTSKGIIAAAPSDPANRMADLPISQPYRDQMTQPVTVPGMTGPSPLPTLPVAYALTPTETPDTAQPTGPVLAQAAAPEVVTVDPQPDTRDTAPQTFMLAEQTTQDTAKPAAPKTKSVTYTIANGDTLAKIAKKYYNSSKNSDVQRIVAANTAILKDATTTLVVGKPLTIPGVPVTPAVAPTKTADATTPNPPTPGTAKKSDSVVIYTPGGGGGTSSTDTKFNGPIPTPGPITRDHTPAPTPVVTPDSTKRPAPKTYVVQSGDTLEKIAKKLFPNNTTAMIEKIKSTNNIKDPRSLQVNQTLKLPV